MPDGSLIRLVHGASAMANRMGMSVIQPARCEDLAQIAAWLPEAGPELMAEGFKELTASVLTKVNGVEMSLGSGSVE